jgi:hypothetical protein
LHQLGFAIRERPVQCASAEFRDQRPAAEQDDTGFGIFRMSEDLWKIQVIREEYVPIQAGIVADFSIGCGNATD